MQLEKLVEAEKKTKPIIQAIQEQIDESAKEMASQNAEHQKRKQELEEKYQKQIAELEVFIIESNLHPNNQ
jgi:predicted house-cleaning noncanonical NTP pyrophosphatase (MazG superfamily)